VSTYPDEALRARNLVWHYTTLESLQLILESGTLMATEVGYQNDPLEPDTAYEAIRLGLHKLAEQPSYGRFANSALHWQKEWRNHFGFIRGHSGRLTGTSRFIFCASTDPDNLYAWRTYAAGSRTGCAIGLDASVPLGLFSPANEAGVPNFSPWTTVEYDQEALVRIAVDTLKKVGDVWNREAARGDREAQAQEDAGIPESLVEYNDYAFGVLLSEFGEAIAEVTAVAKHSSFRDEHETRVTVSDGAFAVTFSPGRDGPRPRVRLTSTPAWGKVATKPMPLPIRAIVLAPNASSQASTTAHWLLHANDYPIDPVQVIDESGPEPILWEDPTQMIELYHSAHPYRDV